MKKECNELQTAMSAYLDGESSDKEKKQVFLHLAECSDCRSFWESLIRLKFETGRQRRISASSILDARVASIVPSMHRSSRSDDAVTRSPYAPDQPLSASMGHASAFLRIWQKRIPVPVALLLLLVMLVGSVGLTSLWQTKPERIVEPVVFVSLPTVEVEANIEPPNKTNR